MPKGPRLGGVKHGCRASARYSTPVNNLPSQPAAGLPACCPLRERHITTAAPPPPPPPPPLPPTPYTHLLPTHPATPTPPTPRARRVAAGVSQGRVGERGARAPPPAPQRSPWPPQRPPGNTPSRPSLPSLTPNPNTTPIHYSHTLLLTWWVPKGREVAGVGPGLHFGAQGPTPRGGKAWVSCFGTL